MTGDSALFNRRLGFEASMIPSDTCCVFLETFIAFANPLTAAQSCKYCWTTFGIESRLVIIYRDNTFLPIPTLDPFISDLALVIMHAF